MSSKRSSGPDFISNPFIKKRNLDWVINEPSVTTPKSSTSQHHVTPPRQPTSSAIESGELEIDDHATHFGQLLSKYVSTPSTTPPLLSIPSYLSLYETNVGSRHGAHFVIHQHDHPIAGTHYDLRLQINETSSASWAIMYGLPGDPNSIRLTRNATETRIHCLWNHLIETASSATGSLLIWDTGTYTILPRPSKHAPAADPSSPSSSPPPSTSTSQQDLLHAAFQNRKIRLQLHGSRLPAHYVLNLRLTKSEDASGRAKSSRTPQRRRRRGRLTTQVEAPEETSEEETEDEEELDQEHVVEATDEAPLGDTASAMEREIREMEDEHVRKTNTYIGANNTIGSVHQRRWYLSLDRPASGFVQQKRIGRSVWAPRPDTAHACTSRPYLQNALANGNDNRNDSRLQFPFYVRGVEHETSVVTGRQGGDILRDEGVTCFTPRKGWQPVLK